MLQVGDAPQGGKKKLQAITLFSKDYLYSPARDTFVAVSAMPLHMPDQICSALAALHLISQGDTYAPFAMLVGPPAL